MEFQQILDALSQSGGGFQRQDLSDIRAGTEVPDAEGYKNLAKGVGAATVGLPGDLESLARMIVEARSGVPASDTVMPTSIDVGDSFGADTESAGFGVGEVFGLDPFSKITTALTAVAPLVMRIGKGGAVQEIADALFDTAKQKKVVTEGFDPRFDPRVKEQQKLNDLTVGHGGDRDPLPEIPMENLEGRGIVTSMSDRTAEGADITNINGVELVRPVGRHGGQGFMGNPENIEAGNAWQSAETPVLDINEHAKRIEALTGQKAILAPWQMSPSGSDFSLSTGDAMLTYAASNMDNVTKAELDKAINEYVTIGVMKPAVKDDAGKIITPKRRVGDGKSIKGFKGVDDPNMFSVWSKQPDVVRKELKNMMDKQFRNKGGLGIGEARLAIADQNQLMGADTSLINLAEIDTKLPMTHNVREGTYPKNVRGQVLGKVKEDVRAYDLIPEAVAHRNRIKSRREGAPLMDIQNPTANDKRALQMKAFSGIVTEDILRAIKN